MITKGQLLQLGYEVRIDQVPKIMGTDFTHPDFYGEFRLYLKDGVLIVKYPSSRSTKLDSVSFDNFEDFLKWHNQKRESL